MPTVAHSLNSPVARTTVVALLAVAGSGMAHATTLDEYRSLIVACRRGVEQDGVSEARLQNLRSRLSAVTTVTYPGGTSVKVNTSPLVAALRRLPEHDPARSRFATLERLLTPAGKTPTIEDPRMQAEQILAGQEFAELRKVNRPAESVVPGWWTRFSRWTKETLERFAEWLNKLLRDRQSPRASDASGVRTLVKFLQFLLYFLIGVAALVGVYLLARSAAARGWLNTLLERRRRGSSSDLDLDLSGDGIADPLGAAKSLAAQGAYREAVRMAYIASLRRLQEDGLLVLESNRTNWEYQRDLRERSRTASDTLLPATRLFDRVWYGRRTGTAQDFQEAVRVHDALGELPNESPGELEETGALSEPGGPL